MDPEDAKKKGRNIQPRKRCAPIEVRQRREWLAFEEALAIFKKRDVTELVVKDTDTLEIIGEGPDGPKKTQKYLVAVGLDPEPVLQFQ